VKPVDRSLCRVCGTRLRQGLDPVERRLCRQDADRGDAATAKRRLAGQRRRRYGTTAPPLAVSAVRAHHLHDTWTRMAAAENAVRSLKDVPTEVTRLLERLQDVHKVVQPLVDEVDDVLRDHPWALPPLTWRD
jgi:hypothetical protein